MCHVSMKLSDRFDPNQMYAYDKIMVEHISVKETLLKLDLESQGSKIRANNRIIGNKQSKALLGNCSGTDESSRL